MGTSRTSPVACRTCPQSGWPPASARVRPPDTRPDTVSADQFLMRTPGSGWPGDGHGGPLDRPVGRTSPVQGDRLADGYGPVRTATAKRRTPPAPSAPTMRLASRPRPTRLLAHPGSDRTDGNAHARLRPTPAVPERPPAWSPSNVHAAVSGAHDGRHDRTGSGQRMPGRVRPDTVPSTGHASRTGSDADRGTDERHGRHSDILDRHDHKAARRDTPSLSCGAGVCGLATKVGSAMATLPARPLPRQ